MGTQYFVRGRLHRLQNVMGHPAQPAEFRHRQGCHEPVHAFADVGLARLAERVPGGIVFLEGQVGSSAERDLAQGAARAVPGLRCLRSEISVSAP